MSYASDQTDKMLLKTEKKITKIYKDAERSLNDVWDNYINGYDEAIGDKKIHHKSLKERYAEQYKAFQKGEYTEDQFKAWYRTQIQRGERYKKLVDDVASRITDVNKVASAYINDQTPSVYSLNANYTAYEIEQEYKGASFTFVNDATVRELITTDKNFTEFRTVKLNPARDYEWNSEQIHSALTSGILQGKSIDKLTDAFMVVMKRNRSSAIRNARTAYTSAQNGGTLSSMEKAKDMGIETKKQWKSMEDERVRFSHAMLNGQIRDLDKPFDNGLMYPSDSKGAPAEVYNCRCTLLSYLPKYEDKKSVENYSEDSGSGESYEQWIKRKQNELKGKDEADLVKDREFIKSNYKDLATIEEAEAYAKANFVQDGRWGSNGTSYKGISLETANEINKTLSDFYANFNADKLSGISAPAGNTKLGQKMQTAHMGYNTITGDLLLNRSSCKNLATVKEAMKKEYDIIANYIKDPSRYKFTTSYAERIAKASAVSGRSSVPVDMESGLWHELGHSIQKKIQASDRWDTIKANMDTFAPKVSGYSTATDHEYIAESFCSYMRKEDIIDPILKEAFDELRK